MLRTRARQPAAKSRGINQLEREEVIEEEGGVAEVDSWL